MGTFRFASRHCDGIHGRMCGHMGIDQATDLVRETLTLALITAAPLLGIGLVVGLVISLFQAVTQIQEQMLVFLPKIVAMFAVAGFVMPWVTHRLMEFAGVMFAGGVH